MVDSPHISPVSLGVFNGDVATVREALERYEDHGPLRVSNGWRPALNDIQREYANLFEQLEALEAWSQRALADFNVQLDKAPENLLPHMQEVADLVTSYPANEPHLHTWSLPEGAGVYRCMTCGVETSDLGAPLPASIPKEGE